MKRIAVAALVLVAVACGVAVYMFLRVQDPAAAGDAAAQQARDAFFAARGNGTPAPDVAVTGNDTSGKAPGRVGVVTAVDGDRFTIRNPADSTTTTLHLAPGSPVQREVSGTPADLVAGTRILAIGTTAGGTLTARTIQITTPGAGGGAVFIQKGSGGVPPSGTSGGPVIIQSTPGAGGATPPVGGQTTTLPPLAGTITQVAGTLLTVRATDGTTATVQVADSTAIRKQAAGTPVDVHVGDTIAAQGSPVDGVFEASSLQVLQPAAP